MIRRENVSGLQLEIDTHQCQLSERDVARLEADAASLARQVARFPLSDLRVLIAYNARTTDYSVKTTLILDGATLVANDHDRVMHAAFLHCLTNLAENIRAFKERLARIPERQKQGKGTAQELFPLPDPDPVTLDRALAANDYAAFRVAMLGYEEPLRKRIGRWVERYPEVNARIGRGLEVADILEEVFLLAFEQYAHRPAHLRLGEWLDGLIDPALKVLQQGGEAELENISQVRSAVEAQQGPWSV